VDEYEDDPSNQITLRFEADSDGTGKLYVRASADGFSGRSAAWFDSENLLRFTQSLEAYPLPEDSPPHVASGFGNVGERLEQEHVSLTFRPVGSRGQVGVEVHLASEVWPETRPESKREVQLELLTTYERLRLFANHLARVVAGELPEAIIGGEQLM
jgi:hypothetical protein